MNSYTPKIYRAHEKGICVNAPASKSITNRAFLLAALSSKTVRLTGGALGEDTRAFAECLQALGIRIDEEENAFTVYGCGGDIPVKNAALNVRSAGTAARFLTVALAFCGGDYTLDSSEQMRKRPMKELLDLLRGAGVSVTCLREQDRFPFRLRSQGFQADCVTVNTDKSSQFASALLLSAGVRKKPLTVALTGARTQGSYLGITLNMLKAFHIPFQKKDNAITVFPAQDPPAEYAIEPDVSGACYFYALSLLCGETVTVAGVRQNSMQGDMQFLELLKEKGVRFFQTPQGLTADGSEISSYTGFDAVFTDFSDQTMTAAVLAAFAETPSVLRKVGHIRLQECDRIAAICENLNALGARAYSDGENIFITPAPPHIGKVDPHGDHRVAMAFALAGLKTGFVTVEDPLCCRKTFENYFDILEEITR